jgi:hypothetical protein
MEMERYTITQVDGSTFQVVDLLEQREVCVCSNYDDYEDAGKRAEEIASLLNIKDLRLIPILN